MPDPRGFLRPREGLPRRPVPVRIQDWREVYEATDPERVTVQAARCMDCGIPFCHNSCPLGNPIPEFNESVRVGDLTGAGRALAATNNFPELTGLLCPAPCEAACVLGIDGAAVTIKQVEAHIAANIAPVPRPRAARRETSVAIVGSGPTGLAAAQQLARAGHGVTVYERDEQAGGLLRFGIPDFKLEKRRVDDRIRQLTAEGIVFELGCDVGVAIAGDRLLAEHSAVLVAAGALQDKDAPEVPGRHLGHVQLAMDYLVAANRAVRDGVAPAIDAAGKRVVIIGGGDTGADCLGTAHRQGARSVTQLDRYPEPPAQRDPRRDPWPMWPWILRTYPAHEEGGKRLFAVAVKEFRPGSVVLQQVVVEKDRVVRPIPGLDQVLDADLVLLAIGFAGTQRQAVLDQLGVRISPEGVITVDENWAAGTSAVFAAGDARRGASLIVWAIAEGRSAAAAIHHRLTGRNDLPAPVRPQSRPLSVGR